MLSVIVPVYNDPDGVRTTIESVRPQVTDVDAHLVVVDNGSTDRTPAVIDEYADGDSIRHIAETGMQSSYAARNAGVRNTGGGVLAFLDADMTVSEGWLRAGVEHMEETGASYVGGNVELRIDEPTLAARYDRHTGFPVRQYVRAQRFAPTCSLFVRRSLFNEVGLFDPRLRSGGDKEFGNRVAEADYDLAFTPEATAYHPTRQTFRALVRKELRVGRGHCLLQRYYPDRYGRPGIPPRPSGVKSPDRDLPARDRAAFGALAAAMTATRGVGYSLEFLGV